MKRDDANCMVEFYCAAAGPTPCCVTTFLGITLLCGYALWLFGEIKLELCDCVQQQVPFLDPERSPSAFPIAFQWSFICLFLIIFHFSFHYFLNKQSFLLRCSVSFSFSSFFFGFGNRGSVLSASGFVFPSSLETVGS